MPDGTHVAAFVSGVAAFLTIFLVHRWVKDEADEDLGLEQRRKTRAEKKIKKLMKSVQECVDWQGVQVLGLLPRLWIEVLDTEHRYGALLYGYWCRWELSTTEEDFFDWLTTGAGSRTDLPNYPRRLLDESKIKYLTCDQQKLFRVKIIPGGRFVWAMDGTPVSLPPESSHVAKTPRELQGAALVEPVLRIADRRDQKLVEARAAVDQEIAAGKPPSQERMNAIARPLVQEGLLRQLRDPFFADRVFADSKHRLGRMDSISERDLVSWPTTVFEEKDEKDDLLPQESMARHAVLAEPIPDELLQNLTWEDFLQAIDHDEGRLMDKPFPKASDRATGDGIFVVDKFGILYCGSKIRGVFQHSSFVRGHCVKVAGGLTLVSGQLTELSPHSGHYQPMQETFEEMKAEWRNRGVNFDLVKEESFVKT